MCSVDTQPLRSLKELWDWKPDGISQNLIAKPLQNCEFHQKRTETLICHDMAGGYLPEERFTGCQITEKSTPFIVMHWWYMDIFVYFSHQFITIPPVGWINQAHSHKVMVLGTFITEWTSGAKICSEILASAENVERTVDKLVEIAKFYNFEGWLVNIENEIEPTQLEMLHRFVSLLTERSRAALGECSRVIWYDAVTIEGKLVWQNCLNDANERWFNETNGIFLNYNWTLEKLQETLKRAEQRNHRVYVGVDCFGRGCYGGGGWNCCEAFKQIRKNDLSVALFAPGWVAETLPPSDIISNSLRFWDRLGAFLHSRPINSLPLETDFSVGFHETSDNCVCYNLSKASLQPHYLANGAFPTAGRSSSLILPGRTIYK
ncbi:unnamed protein product [Anisakis simplex]|uniref:Mannosyl-glycoprotein endo-beta-N-acetylglucosaminidase n=1 Tax=Anisakis simplex TaxID=6269 RepID=A0A0M3K1F0_ANISI|nr:unnamed protein product [Anisakis simplex]